MQQTTADAAELAALQADFPGYRIWRAKRQLKEEPVLVPGAWMASRLVPTAGVDRTLMEGSATALRSQLADQRNRAAAGERSHLVAALGYESGNR